MVHQLYYNNDVIVDIETTKEDLRSVVDVKIYSELLLNTDSELIDDLINDFSDLQEIRGEWHESINIRYRFGARKESNIINVSKFVVARMREISEKWKLQYFTD